MDSKWWLSRGWGCSFEKSPRMKRKTRADRIPTRLPALAQGEGAGGRLLVLRAAGHIEPSSPLAGASRPGPWRASEEDPVPPRRTRLPSARGPRPARP